MITSIVNLPSTIVPSRVTARRSRAATQQTADLELIRRIAEGNKLAMQVLYMRHNVRVFRFVLRFVHNESAAEDLVQEVFLDVWRTADRFEGRSEVSTWLLAIARNKAAGMLRHRPTEPLNEDTAALIEDLADTPEMAVRKNEGSAIMQQCLMQLSPAHREIIDLVYYHERTVEDAARIVGVGVNTVKTRMFYARKQLAELLRAQGTTTAVA